MKKILLMMTVVGVLLTSACKKDSDDSADKAPDVSGKTNQQIFMIQPWKVYTWRDSSVAGDFENIESCAKDDVYTFKTTTLLQLTANTKCDPMQSATEDYAWSMSSPTANTVNIWGFSWSIVKINGDKIELRKTTPDEITSIVVFSRK